MSRKNLSIDRTLDDPSSDSNMIGRQQRMRIRTPTNIDRSTLASQSTEGRFKAKHSRKPSESSKQPKKLRNHSNQQGRSKSCMCSYCTACGGAHICCYPDELGAIEEEHEPEERFAKHCEQAREPLFGACDPCAGSHPFPQLNPSAAPHEKDGAYIEFFDIMRDTMEAAVKKSLEDILGQYFTSCLEKIDNLAHQVQHNECILTKIYTDLSEKISYYGDRNGQQFQYLCMRMEHDRLFYQQQQEHFLKAHNRSSSKCQQTNEEHVMGERQSSHGDECRSVAEGEDFSDDRQNLEKRGLEGSKSRLRLPESA